MRTLPSVGWCWFLGVGWKCWSLGAPHFWPRPFLVSGRWLREGRVADILCRSVLPVWSRVTGCRLGHILMWCACVPCVPWRSQWDQSRSLSLRHSDIYIYTYIYTSTYIYIYICTYIYTCIEHVSMHVCSYPYKTYIAFSIDRTLETSMDIALDAWMDISSKMCVPQFYDLGFPFHLHIYV